MQDTKHTRSNIQAGRQDSDKFGMAPQYKDAWLSEYIEIYVQVVCKPTPGKMTGDSTVNASSFSLE